VTIAKNTQLNRLFHVKQIAHQTEPNRLFHVKQIDQNHSQVKQPRTRRAILASAAALVILGTACTGNTAPVGWAAPVTANGLVIVANQNGTISGLRTAGADTPTVAWTYPEQTAAGTPSTDFVSRFFNFVGGLFASKKSASNFSAVYATPRVESVGNQQRVFLASYTGDVIALDAATGKPATGWPASVNVGGRVASTPAFDGKLLYMGTNHGDVRTIDASSGSVGGSVVGTGARVWAEPLLVNGTLYVSSLDHTVRAIDPNSKAQRWKTDVGGAVAGNPTVISGLLVVPTLNSTVVALDLASGEQRWSMTGDNWFWSQPLATNDLVYVASTSGTVYALDRATGSEKWHSEPIHAEVRSAPVLAGGALLIATRNGLIVALDPSSGHEQWRKSVEKTSVLADPLVLDSGIVYSAEDGALYRVTPQDQGVNLLYKRGQ
jgi:outer membrane protein assembly factor BamB